MRSERRGWLLVSLVAAVVPACDSQDRKITDICSTLERCTRYVDPTRCDEMVTDALEDRRITDGEMARCSECLGDHDLSSFHPPPRSPDPEDCYDLLVDRDCDKACEAVPLAIRARTSAEMRQQMCVEVESACGKAVGPSCASRLESEFSGLAIDAQLELDARVADCRQCLVAPSRTPAVNAVTEVEECGALLDACRERCRQVRAVNRIFEVAVDLVAVCKNDASCFLPPAGAAGAASAGSGGFAGSGGTNGSGGSCMRAVHEWVYDVRTPPPGAGAGGSAGASGEGPGGQCNAAGSAGAGSAGAPGCESSTRRDKLADCALCAGTLACDAILTSCGERCSTVTEAR